MKCDLSELESVRAFARAFKAKHGGQLDVLVNNGEASPFISSTQRRTDGRPVLADHVHLCAFHSGRFSVCVDLSGSLRKRVRVCARRRALPASPYVAFGGRT